MMNEELTQQWFDEVIENQERLLSRLRLITSIFLWAVYGKELRELQNIKSLPESGTDRHKQAVVFMIEQILQTSKEQTLSHEEETLFVRETVIWLRLPVVKTIWMLSKFRFSEKDQKFIDGLLIGGR